MWMKGKGIV